MRVKSLYPSIKNVEFAFNSCPRKGPSSFSFVVTICFFHKNNIMAYKSKTNKKYGKIWYKILKIYIKNGEGNEEKSAHTPRDVRNKTINLQGEKKTKKNKKTTPTQLWLFVRFAISILWPTFSDRSSFHKPVLFLWLPFNNWTLSPPLPRPVA